MKAHCPHCGVKGSVDDRYIGKKIRCPKCNETFWCRLDEDAGSAVDSQVGEQQLPPPDAPPAAETSVAAIPPETSEENQSADRPYDEDDQGETSPQNLLDDDSRAARTEEAATNEAADEALPDGSPAASETVSEEVMDEEEIVAFPDDEEDKHLSDAASEDTGEAGSLEIVEDLDQPLTAGQLLPVEPVDLGGEAEDVSPESTEIVEEIPSSPPLSMMPEEDLPALASTAAATDEVRPPPEPPPTESGAAKRIKPRLDFTVGEALNEAWQSSKGTKASIWAAVGVMYLIMLAFGMVLGFGQAALGLSPDSAAGTWAEIGIQSLASALSTFFTAGLMFMGVRRAAGKAITWKMVFSGKSMVVKLIIASILMTLLVISGFFLFILPGIYLGVGYTMTLPLMLDRNLAPWQAMEASRKAIHKVWWKVFGLFFVMGIIYLVSAIPLGIGLIWTVPMSVILIGVVYRYLFGVQAKTD